MGSHPSGEFQVVQPFRFFRLFPIAVADGTFLFIEGEPLQGQQGPEHVSPRPLGLSFCPGPDPVVDIESRVPPGEEAVRPFRAEERVMD